MFNVDRLLDRYEYQEFIIESLHPDNASISDYLFSNYKLHKTINHKFCEIIYEEIQAIINTAESEFKKNKKVSKGEENYKSDKFVVVGINNVLTEIPEESKEFYLQRMSSIDQLNEEYIKFTTLVAKIENNGKSGVKIDWDPKSKNHLYFILKELKNAGLIKNSVTDLALFVKENFPEFANTSIGYITDSIHNGKEPSRGSTKTIEILKDLKSLK
jgi:N-acetylmuramoyl-L-alanine amidase CwlA